ncbi:DUF6507 family protein [Streptomyces lichenis]|uniref:DUF6507 family protein n=1 Tax=Streptomyces lichenis TaxID=2306967 RepID=A0ABT0II16_9ACTN|nr:DUF6507 family protein [Streptomyces lichenis]MCK8680966.1 DUF6507 family protein [Streptomyces lichenis]
MTKWDIDPGGVASILSLVGLAAGDMGKNLNGYGLHVQDAAIQVGTLSDGPYCGAPVGPVGGAIANFASDNEGQIRFLSARLKKTVNGTVEATTAYAQGDLDMAADAQREAAKAPTPAELLAVSEKTDSGSGAKSK